MTPSTLWIVHDLADPSGAVPDPDALLARVLPGSRPAGRLDPAGDPGAALDALTGRDGGMQDGAGRVLVLCQTLAQALDRARVARMPPGEAVQAWMDRAAALGAAQGPRADRIALLPADALARDPAATAAALTAWCGQTPVAISRAPAPQGLPDPDPLMQVIARACLHDVPGLAAVHDALSAASLLPHPGPVDLGAALAIPDRAALMRRRADLLEAEARMTREELSRAHRSQRMTEHRMQVAQTRMNTHLDNVKARLTAQVAQVDARGQAEVARIVGSLSWRVTRPLRVVRRLLGRVRHRLRGR